jgi:hypothetical protein
VVPSALWVEREGGIESDLTPDGRGVTTFYISEGGGGNVGDFNGAPEPCGAEGPDRGAPSPPSTSASVPAADRRSVPSSVVDRMAAGSKRPSGQKPPPPPNGYFSGMNANPLLAFMGITS